jgi:hypothetical protein
MARKFGVSKEAMARAWVEAHREAVAVSWCIVAGSCADTATRIFLGSRTGKGSFRRAPMRCQNSPPEAFRGSRRLILRCGSTRDAARILSLSEQVLGQRDGYSLVLLQAELDEEIDD